MPADATGLGLRQRPGIPSRVSRVTRQCCDRPSPSLMASWQARIDPGANRAGPASITPQAVRCRRTNHPIPAPATVKDHAPFPAAAPRTAPRHAHLLLARALITASNHPDRAVTGHPAGAEAGGEDPPHQEGLPC